MFKLKEQRPTLEAVVIFTITIATAVIPVTVAATSRTINLNLALIRNDKVATSSVIIVERVVIKSARS